MNHEINLGVSEAISERTEQVETEKHYLPGGES